jgi:Tol biopolymer transport system component
VVSRGRSRAAAVFAVAAVLGGVLVVVRGLASPTALAQQENPPGVGRIAFAGTGHRGIGVATSQAASAPFFGAGPEHHDDDVSARGDLVVFTSLRDGRLPQVYLRTGDGAVRRLAATGDAAHPQLSPDLRTVVFDAAGDTGRDLWLVGVDGTGLRRLTDTPEDETWPTFSPDGTQVAFARDGAIFREPVEGGAAVRVTDDDGTAAEPAWNPVDNRIAYTLDGTELRVVDGSGTGTPVLGPEWQARWPVWKPDGTGLLFLSQGGVYETGAGEPTLLLSEDRDLASPALLDGRLLVSRTSAPTASTATLQDILPDGTDPRELGLTVLREDPEAVDNPNLLFHPRPGFDPWTQREEYSPDGRRIVVTRFEDVDGVRAQRLWLVDADGANPSRVPVADRQTTDWEFDPAWSPDGRFLAFARRSPGGVRPDGGPSHVVIVDVASGDVVGRLTPPPEVADQEDTQPAWSPDGTLLSFTRGIVSDGPNGEIRDNHVWTARAGTLDQQRDVSAAVCGFDCAVTDDSSTFSPDSARLVFNRERDGLIEATLADDGCQVLLPATPGTCAAPVDAPAGPFQPRDAGFSPDGTRLVLTTRRAESSASPEELAVLDPATGGLDRIATGLPGRQKEPAWQPSADLTVTAPPVLDETAIGQTTRVTVTVTNRGPASTRDTELTVARPGGVRIDSLQPSRGTCEVAALRCDLGALAPDEPVTIDADLVAVAPGGQQVTWSAAGDVIDVQPSDNAAETELPVAGPPAVRPSPPAAGPGLAVDVVPNPSYVGGRATLRYTVRNGRGVPATGLRLDFALPRGVPVATLPPGCSAAGCALPDLPSSASVVVLVGLAPNVPLRTTAGGTLRTTGTDANPADNVANTPVVVLQPRIVAVPPIGKPGFVTSVRGLDFPPGVPVRLTWTPGITAAAAPTFPRGDGSFIAQLLILTKDQTGPRTITAAGPGFSPVTTPFLVVSGSIAPPDMVERR